MPAVDRKGKYQPWSHEEFMADRRVRRMTPTALKTYMMLLHEGFVCSTRPYLPDNEEELEMMAFCTDHQEWMEARDEVLGMFEKTEIDGQAVLFNKRMLSDWENLLDIREKRSEAGIASGKARRAKRTHLNRCSDGVQQETNKEVKELSKEKEVNLSEETEPNEIPEQDRQEEMKLKKEIQAVCAGYGVNGKGFPDTWEQMSALEITHSRGAVVRDFTEFMSENRGDDFPRGAVSAYLRTAYSRLSEGGTSVQSAAKAPEVQELVRTLSRASGGQIDFLDKHRARLGEVLKEFTAEEITTGFKNWLESQDEADLPKFGAGKFAQVADSRADQVRISRIEKQKAEETREATKQRLQEEAEAERRKMELEKSTEEALDDPINM